MKKLMIVLIVLAFALVGCNAVAPEEVAVEEEVVAEPDILCDGYYATFYDDFQMKVWGNCDYYAPTGIYWVNYADGRMFFLAEIGETEIETDCCEDGIGYDLPDPIALFGECPNGYEFELVVPEAEAE
ncbi:MAG: hypothetical protein R6U11_03150 [Bacteroidales bacterium]